MTKEDKELGKFEGLVIAKLESIEGFIKIHDDKEAKQTEAVDIRICKVEQKQDKFAWYIGIAVGVGMAIMFAVDKVWAVYEKIKG